MRQPYGKRMAEKYFRHLSPVSDDAFLVPQSAIQGLRKDGWKGFWKGVEQSVIGTIGDGKIIFKKGKKL